ncbi:type VI secretion system protein TssL, short form [Enterobacteriaceae bacterium LUAb1]
MNPSDHNITASTLDTLMQETWLLVLAIRNHPPVTVDDALYLRCRDMIQQVQDKLAKAGVPAYLTEEIKFAHAVFIDEAVMMQPETDVSVWWQRTPLQGHFLGHLHGGEHFYEHIKKLLRDPSPAEAVVACYHRMLTLGYQGKYINDGAEENEERQSLLKQLGERLPAATDKINAPIFILNRRPDMPFWRRAPWVIRLLGLLLMVAMSCAMSIHLHYLLRQWYTLHG